MSTASIFRSVRPTLKNTIILRFLSGLMRIRKNARKRQRRLNYSQSDNWLAKGSKLIIQEKLISLLSFLVGRMMIAYPNLCVSPTKQTVSLRYRGDFKIKTR